MNYRIGVVSKLLGISPEGLRLYEREGILSSKREDGNGNYRVYSHLDITALMRARSYHNYGFSLKETESLINADDLASVAECYRSRQQKLREEILLKQRMLDYLSRVDEMVETLPEELWKIKRARRPAMYRFEFMDGDDLIIGPELYQKFQEWVNLAPFSFPAQRNEWQAVCGREGHSLSALGIFEEDAAFFGIEESGPVVYYPECDCLSTIVELVGEETDVQDYLGHLREYVEINGIEVKGDPVGRTFLSMNKKDNYTRYRQIWLPV